MQFNKLLIILCYLEGFGWEWVYYHNCDVIMGAMASQITSITIVYLAVYSGRGQRKCRFRIWFRSPNDLSFANRSRTSKTVTSVFSSELFSEETVRYIGGQFTVLIQKNLTKNNNHQSESLSKPMLIQFNSQCMHYAEWGRYRMATTLQTAFSNYFL